MSIDLLPIEYTRFMAKVTREGECVVWTGAIQSRGYGVFRADGKAQLAHRIAYETFVGPIPDGLQLDHICRNRACVNPEHLEPVTARQNVRRGDVTRATDAECAHGHPWTDLTERYSKHGWRFCATCVRESAKRRKRAA